jgi:hypothetical protein
VAAQEIPMVDLREPINPERKGQIDTIGWLFVAFVVLVVVAAAGILLQ